MKRYLEHMKLWATELSREEEAHLDMILAHDLWCKKHRGNHGRDMSRWEAYSIFKEDAPEDVRREFESSRISDTMQKKQRVKSIPMIDVVRRYGYEPRMNKINCCFHEDPGASLHVYEDSWYCFGCGKGGDQIDFVMRMQKCNFIEALNFLA